MLTNFLPNDQPNKFERSPLVFPISTQLSYKVDHTISYIILNKHTFQMHVYYFID